MYQLVSILSVQVV